MADGSAGAAAAMADGSADGPAADATGRKAELRAKLDTLYSQMAALEVEALGLDHIPELAPGAGADSPSADSPAAGSPPPESEAAAPAEPGPEGEPAPEPELVPAALRGMDMSRSEVRKVQSYLEQLDGWRERYAGAEEAQGLLVNERHYARALECLLANQHTQLATRRSHVEELQRRLKETKVEHRTEVEAAISDALQTPMQHAAETIIGLIGSLGENDDVALPLAQVLSQISGNDMYQPRMLSEGYGADDVRSPGSQQWISATFSSSAATRSRLDQRRGAMSMESGNPADLMLTDTSGKATMESIAFDQFGHPDSELSSLVSTFFGKWSLFEEFKVRPPPTPHTFLFEQVGCLSLNCAGCFVAGAGAGLRELCE